MFRFKSGRFLTQAAMVAGIAILPTSALAAVTISAGATQNVACANGICTPTSRDAVLNVSDLENFLASGNVEVTSTGFGVEAEDIDIKAALSWSNSSALALDAHKSIAIDQPVSIEGLAGLALKTGKKKGALSFGNKGSVTFANLSGRLTIDGVSYTLENTIQSLANAIAGNPSGTYAFAADYNASQDGTYTSVPIPTTLTGTLEGLGHRISNLTVDDLNDPAVGLFAYMAGAASLRDIKLVDANMTAEMGSTFGLGAFVGTSYGTLTNVESVRGVLYGAEGEDGGSNVGGLAGILYYDSSGIFHSSASGSVINAGPEGAVGGLVGFMEHGTIEQSRSSVSLSSAYEAGGLVGESDDGQIDQTFATGKVSIAGSGTVGGLVGSNFGTVTNSYSTGAVSVGNGGYSGGLAGWHNQEGFDDGATISDSYSTGKVKRASGAVRGGLLGNDSDPGDMNDDYWDLDTSSITKMSEGAGSPNNDSGITGLTTAQLQSGLPAGFDPSIWGENSNINGGLPYLLANPPK